MLELQRAYEVSIWTLQDEFISVLKPLNLENKGMIENKEFKINTTDINKYSFSIPMYIYQGKERILNPIWYNTSNGNIITNLRKIKVILNKNTQDEEVYEFLIVKVDDRHEKDQLYCDIVCEEMGFHELGKIGYKISLSSEEFYEEDDEWFKNGAIPEEEPRATLQYWNNKFLVPTNENPSSTEWGYEINMDWSCYSSADLRDSDKVYEEEYVASWDSELQPKTVAAIKEKERLVDIEESNVYNITQQLAEIFNVFVKYKYIYDTNYHIVGRKIIYYNNFIEEKNGFYDITYPFDATKIVRSLEASDISTKMFVRPTDNKASESGMITILDVDANKTKEDYILNFDYLRAINGITNEQLDAISKYEEHMYTVNTYISNLDQQILAIDDNLPEYKAKVTLLTNSIALDKERINAADEWLNQLDAKDGDEDGAITISNVNPATGILIQSKQANDDSYYLNLSVGGIIYETLYIYNDYNFSTNSLSNLLTGVPVYDEYNNLTQITGLHPADITKKRVYMTYKYKPALQYEQVKQTWLVKLAKDQDDLEEIQSKYTLALENRETLNNSRTWILGLKKKYITEFEQTMGPAIRESYWQPEDYKDYGDKYIDSFTIPSATSEIVNGSSTHTKLFWDDELFEDEQKTFYQIGIEGAVKNYPCINLSGHLDYISENLDSLSFMYYDYNESAINPYEPKNIKNYAIGSNCKLGFLNINNVVTPVLILTFTDSLSQEQLARIFSSAHQPQIGVLDVQVSGTGLTTTITSSFEITANMWITSTTTPVYPRIQLDTLNVLIDDEKLGLLCNGNPISEYNDYYVLSRVDGCYYITIRPEILFKESNFQAAISFKFAISNASTSIYLDAIEVLKENAFPKVSYSLEPNMINKELTYTTYKLLNQIVHINDIDLKLENVQGYVSAVTLDLDKPWEDKIEIKNYKNKFEDLFSAIVAQTEAMQKNERAISNIGVIFDSRDGIDADVLQQSMLKADLNYAFNNGTLTMDEENGIWATSDNGVVAMRGGGIFTATKKDEDGNWIWNTGIIPEGINADLITTGQLDTNRIKIYAGDKVRFQLNGEGLFAFKSFLEDNGFTTLTSTARETIQAAMEDNADNGLVEDLDSKQYVKLDQNGLFLIAEENAYVLNADKTDYIRPTQDVTRVEISWYGLKLRNWAGEEVFYADPDTGNLTIKGALYANELHIGTPDGQGGYNYSTGTEYINDLIDESLYYYSLVISAQSVIRQNLTSTDLDYAIEFVDDPVDLSGARTVTGVARISLENNRPTQITIFDPSVITLQGYYKNIDDISELYDGIFKIEACFDANGSDWQLAYMSSALENTYNFDIESYQNTVFNPITYLRCSLYLNDGQTLVQQTILPVTKNSAAESIEEYCLWSSNTVAPPMENTAEVTWSTTQPTYVSNKYYWRRIIITTVFGDTEIIGPYLLDGLTGASSTANSALSTANGALSTAQSKNKTITSTTAPTSGYQIGDIWFNPTTSKQCMAVRVSDPTAITDWVSIVGEKIHGATLDIDPNQGKINILASQAVDIETNGTLTLTGDNGLTIGSGSKINVATNGSINVAAGSLNVNTNGNLNISSGGALTISSQGTFDISSNNLIIKSNASNNEPLFAIGSNFSSTPDYALKYQNGTLTVKGAIEATAFTLSGTASISTSDISGLDTQLSSLGTQIGGINTQLDSFAPNNFNNGLYSDYIYDNKHYSLALTGKGLFIGSNSGILITGQVTHDDETTTTENIISLNSNGITISSYGVVDIQGGILNLTGANGGNIEFFDAEGNSVFSVGGDGIVRCKALEVTTNVKVEGEIQGTNVQPVAQTTTWYGTYHSANGNQYNFNWMGQDLINNTQYNVTITIKAKNISGNTLDLRPEIWNSISGNSSVYSCTMTSTSSSIIRTWTEQFTYITSASGFDIHASDWYAKLYARPTGSSSVYYTQNAGYYNQANTPQIILEFKP